MHQLNMFEFRILFKKSGTKNPRVELEEIGPAIDFKLLRTKLASSDLFKNACKQPKELKVGSKKLYTFDFVFQFFPTLKPPIFLMI